MPNPKSIYELAKYPVPAKRPGTFDSCVWRRVNPAYEAYEKEFKSTENLTEFSSEELIAELERKQNEIDLAAQKYKASIGTERKEEARRLREEQEERKREQAALAAQKKAKGLAEVVVGSIVTLLDVESGEEIKCYLASGEQKNRHDSGVYVENYETPPGGADFCVHADSNMGQAICGKFVRDEVSVEAPNGKFSYLILDAQPCLAAAQTRVKPVSRNDNEAEIHSSIGSEAYCFFARDNGQFGSFVNHDNYGDESNAESNDNPWLDSVSE